MRFLLRIIIVATLGITILVTWRLLWTPGGNAHSEAELLHSTGTALTVGPCIFMSSEGICISEVGERGVRLRK